MGFCNVLRVSDWNGARRKSERFPGRPGKFPGLTLGSRWAEIFPTGHSRETFLRNVSLESVKELIE